MAGFSTYQTSLQHRTKTAVPASQVSRALRMPEFSAQTNFTTCADCVMVPVFLISEFTALKSRVFRDESSNSLPSLFF